MRELLRIAVAPVATIGLALAGESPDPRVALSEAQIEWIISHTHSNFWGKAVGMDGKLLLPSDDAEREQLLIPRTEAVRIVNEAREYGLTLRCELDWQPVYLKYMQVERTKGWGEKQIAFVGMLFGVTQGAVKDWVGGTCTTEERAEIRKELDAELNRFLAMTLAPTSPSAAADEGQVTIDNLVWGLVCGEQGKNRRVCFQTNSIEITGESRCVYAGQIVPCTWYGFSFDYELPKDMVTLQCTWSADHLSDLGDPEAERSSGTSESRYELELKNRKGNFFNPQYSELPTPQRVMAAVKRVHNRCFYQGKELFAVTFELRYPER